MRAKCLFVLFFVMYHLGAECSDPVESAAAPITVSPNSSAEVTPGLDPNLPVVVHNESGRVPESSSPTSNRPTPTPASNTILSSDHGTTKTPGTAESVSPSVKADHSVMPSPVIGQVFVPLKEWKQRKLEDIESKARRIQTPPHQHESTGTVETADGYIDRQTHYQYTLGAEDFACPVLPSEVLTLFNITLCQCAGDEFGYCLIPEQKAPVSVLEGARKAGKIKRVSGSPEYGVGESAELISNEVDAIARDDRTDGRQQSDDSNSLRREVASLQNNRKNSPQRLASSSDSTSGHDEAEVDKGGMKGEEKKTVSNLTKSGKPDNDLITPGTLTFQKFKRRYPPDSVFGASVTDFVKSMWAVSTVFGRRSKHVVGLDETASSLGTSGSLLSSGGADSESNGDLNPLPREATEDMEANLSKILGNTSSQRGTPLVKERPFNFASADAGARILSYSDGIVGAKNVIEASVDKYSLALCEGVGIGGSRWIDIELSEDVILESVEAANFEYYSSSARRVAVLGAGSYPAERWNVLGIFEFADVRTIQRFQIKKRVVTRFLRVMFAGKQGHEYYCPISTIRAFGKNLIADWKDTFDGPRKNSRNVKVNNNGGKEGQGAAREKEEVNLKTMQGIRNAAATEIEKRREKPEEQQNQSCSDPVDVERNASLGSRDQNLEREVADKSASESSPTPSVDELPTSNKEGSKHVSDEQKDPSQRPNSNEPEMQSSSDAGAGTDTISEEDQIVLDAVRANALSSESGDENIFRKVTRMLRLLELNQTLTNQYIDTHLARFADALSSVQLDSAKAQSSATLTERKVAHIVSTLETTIAELKSAAVKRDIIMCVLVICIAFLLGTHWVLWTAVSGTRLHESNSEFEISDIVSRSQDSHLDSQSLQTRSQGANRDTAEEPLKRVRSARRKSIGDVRDMGVQRLEDLHSGWGNEHERSISSIDLSSVSKGQTMDTGNID